MNSFDVPRSTSWEMHSPLVLIGLPPAMPPDRMELEDSWSIDAHSTRRQNLALDTHSRGLWGSVRKALFEGND